MSNENMELYLKGLSQIISALDDYPLETKEAHFLVTEVLDVLAKEVHENGK